MSSHGGSSSHFGVHGDCRPDGKAAPPHPPHDATPVQVPTARQCSQSPNSAAHMGTYNGCGPITYFGLGTPLPRLQCPCTYPQPPRPGRSHSSNSFESSDLFIVASETLSTSSSPYNLGVVTLRVVSPVSSTEFRVVWPSPLSHRRTLRHVA
jgi:hypothetical protein